MKNHLFIIYLILAFGLFSNTGYSQSIHQLIKKRKTVAAKTIINQSQQLNELDKHGNTPLLKSIQQGSLAAEKEQYLELVHLLIEKGANLNIANEFGQTALSQALTNGYIDLSNSLLDHNIDYSNRSDYLILAVKTGNDSIVNRLLQIGIDVKQKATNGRTALHEAVELGQEPMVELLLENGAQIHVKTQEKDPYYPGYTALHIAAMHGYVTICSRLINMGARVNTVGHDGSSPLHLAAGNRRLEEVKIPIQSPKPKKNKRQRYSKQKVEVKGGNLALVKYLLNQGAVVDQLNHKGMSPLHIAALGKQYEMMNYLIEKGAQVYPLGEEAEDCYASGLSYFFFSIGHLEAKPLAQSNLQLAESYFHKATKQFTKAKQAINTKMIGSIILEAVVNTLSYVGAKYQANTMARQVAAVSPSGVGHGFASYEQVNFDNGSLKERKQYVKAKIASSKKFATYCESSKNCFDQIEETAGLQACLKENIPN